MRRLLVSDWSVGARAPAATTLIGSVWRLLFSTSATKRRRSVLPFVRVYIRDFVHDAGITTPVCGAINAETAKGDGLAALCVAAYASLFFFDALAQARSLVFYQQVAHTTQFITI